MAQTWGFDFSELFHREVQLEICVLPLTRWWAEFFWFLSHQGPNFMHESVCQHPMSYLVPVRLLIPNLHQEFLESFFTQFPLNPCYRVSRYTVHHFLPRKISLPFFQVQLCIQIFDGILFYPETLSICNRRVPCYVNLSYWWKTQFTIVLSSYCN